MVSEKEFIALAIAMGENCMNKTHQLDQTCSTKTLHSQRTNLKTY